MKKINVNLNETVIRGTFKNSDLIPAFLEVIKNTAEYAQIINTIPSYALEDDNAEYWEREECFCFLESLINILDSFAPAGFYFGTTEGDSSDFGFWETSEMAEF